TIEEVLNLPPYVVAA
nr:RecName: Full=15 kDa cell wall protein [Nicotiana tabacum]